MRYVVNPGRLQAFDKSFSVPNKLEFETGDVVYLDSHTSEWPSLLLEILAGAAVLRSATAPAEGNAVIRPEAPNLGGELIEIFDDSKRLIDFSSKVRSSPRDYEEFVRRRARLVGYVFGEPKQFTVGLTVREEYSYSFAAINDEASFQFPELTQLRRYGLYDKIDYATETLSGGESHRLNLACALDTGARIIVCDLSASNLDRTFIAWLEEEISVLRKERIIILYNARRPSFFSICNRFIRLSRATIREVAKSGVSKSIARARTGIKVSRPGLDDPLLRVDNVYVPGRSLPVSFELSKGQVRLVHGNNGVGKTTLGKILSNQIDSRAFLGRIYPRPKMLNSLMTFQYPSSFPPQLRLSEMFSAEAISRYKLDLFSESQFVDLPTGVKKAVYILKMLSAKADLYILDEPFAAVDFEFIPFILEQIEGMKSSTFLICNHEEFITDDDPIFLGV